MSFQTISAEEGGVSPALLKPPRGLGAQDTPVRKLLSVLPFRVVMRLLVAQRDGGQGAVLVVSPAGPLTRSELELVEGLGDPLDLADFLPAQEVAKGRSWKLPTGAASAVRQSADDRARRDRRPHPARGAGRVPQLVAGPQR